MTSKLFIVMRKELREALRDRRALGILLMIVVLYPLILWVTLHKFIDLAVKGEREKIELVLIGGQQVPTLLNMLNQKNMNITEHGDMSENEITEMLQQRKVIAVIKVTDKFTENYQAMRAAPIEVWYNSADDIQTKLTRIQNVLRSYNNTIAGARLLAHGVSPATLSPVVFRTYDTATNDSRSARFIGALLGMFFSACFFFSMNTAMDTTAGERERRSLEVLLAQPIEPNDLIVGKWLATSILAIIGLALELICAHIILKWMPLEELGMSWRVSFPMLLNMVLCAVPLCLFAAAFEIALAMNAKTFKEAQAMMSFAVLLPMMPAVVIPMLDLNTANWMFAIPIIANQTLLMEVAKGQVVGFIPYFLTIASSLCGAGLSISFATRRLRSEKYVLSV